MQATQADDVTSEGLLGDDLEPDEPLERLSWSRLLSLLAVVALVAGGAAFGYERASTDAPELVRSWSVPYVDVTLTPTYEFQDPRVNPARDIALAFVVADPGDGCTPSWGGAYTMDEAAKQLELDRRISQLRAAGGDVIVSFGGQANSELATACTDDADLLSAYRSVVERYDVRVVDLDIENAAIADGPSIARRARALAALQRLRSAAGEDLAIWLTLPVTASGLTGDGITLVRSTLSAGVELTGVNAMTMNFGTGDPSSGRSTAMLPAVRSAIESVVTQLAGIYREEGVILDEAQRWAHVGATPMIGQNDVKGEVFTLDDARGLAEYAMENGLGRVSTWSLNRDEPCSASFADVTVVSNTCSSVSQEPLAFAQVFTMLPGRSPSLPEPDAISVRDARQVVDDPARSPYPIWRPEAQYTGGYKVVHRGLVYQARWYNQGAEPSAVGAVPWESPWSLLGPVDPNEPPFAPEKLPAGTYPDWNPEQLYAKGENVLLDGLPYKARWPNQGDMPSTIFPIAPDSAWSPLFSVPGEPAGR